MCLKCHADKAALTKAQTKKGRPVEPLLVDSKKFAASAHAATGCTDCHDGYDRHPHPREAETSTCADCHDEAAAVFEKSVHGKRKDGRSDLPVKCSSCHGVHDVLPSDDRESRLHPLNVIRTCSQCHGDANQEATVEELLALPYTDDLHAEALLERGLVATATCVSCHGGHDIGPKGDPAARTSRLNVQKTCGECHTGVAEAYVGSVHFERLQEQGHKGPACNDCHPPHGLRRARSDFTLDTVAACARCHEERSGTFERTYHGKVSALGFGGQVAACTDCHGTHETRAASDPESRIHPDNLVATCGECHKHANAGFVQYMVHADPSDAENFPGLHALETAMIWLLLGVFTFFGIHTVLWLVRSVAAGERPHRKNGGRFVRRWRPFYTGLHVVFMCSFLALAFTGLPLHFAGRPWAARIMRFVGGPPVASSVHRFAAMVMMGCVAAYIVNVVYRFIVKREKGLWTGPNTMLPRWKDVTDFVGNFGWFLFLRPKPRFDRWTYWEKFDFWAVFWGMFIIGGSGLMLWFPETFTEVMPGWVLNAAIIIHGDEALLAVGFIFTVHMFHSNLRPEKFPMDRLYYTGRITEDEFREERPLEYARAIEAGEYEAMLDDPPRPRTRRRAFLVGAIVMFLGMALTLLAIFTSG